jgi:ribose transport system substrate-binding protein
MMAVPALPLAIAAPSGWNGPTTGPAAQAGVSVVYLGQDARNGGVTGAYRGLAEAAKMLHWQVEFFDAHGDRAQVGKLLEAAIARQPAAIVMGGMQASDFAALLMRARRRHIVLVGWHAADTPGPTAELAVNVTTDPQEVATLAARLVIEDALQQHRDVGAVIFTDSNFAIAQTKAARARAVINDCHGYRGCTVLATEDLPISDAEAMVPSHVANLIARFGERWTYSIAINDIYFDNMNVALVNAKRRDILNVAAGDGSDKAVSRIRSGLSQQLGTVAEPLRQQGFQLADEINRLRAGEQVSGYVAKPRVITSWAPMSDESSDGADFVGAYRAIWRID